MVNVPLVIGKTLPKPLRFVAKNPDGSAFDLTGKTIWFTAKKTLDTDITNASAVFQIAITTHTDPVGGISLRTLTPEETNLFAEGKYFYDIQIGTAYNDRLWSGNRELTCVIPTRLKLL